jgi:hypothetical protein
MATRNSVLNFPVPEVAPPPLPVTFNDQTANGVNLAQNADEVTITDASPVAPTITSVTASGPATVNEGATAQFSAAVLGTGNYNPDVTWLASDGTISAAGLFTAPSKVETVEITAKSVEDPTKFSTIPVSIANSGNTVVIQPSGGNDTAAVLAGLEQVAGTGKVLQLAVGTWHLNPIQMPANSSMLVSPGALLTDESAYPSGSPMLTTANGCTLVGTGAFLQMPLTYGSGQNNNNGNHGIKVTGQNVTVTGFSNSQCGADGFYVDVASNVTISNVSATKCARNGMSIIGQINGLTVNNGSFTNQLNLAQADIANGIDIESNVNTDFLQNIVLNNCITSGNQLDGLAMNLQELDSSSQPVSITVNNHQSSNNGSTVSPSVGGSVDYGFRNNGTKAAPNGTITLNNCTSTGSGYAGAMCKSWCNGNLALVFNGLTIVNPMRLAASDPKYGISAGVGLRVDGGSFTGPGNVQFNATNISSASKNMANYFSIPAGCPNTVFTGGTLGGATNANANKTYP